MIIFEKDKKFIGTFSSNALDPADFSIEKQDNKIILRIGDKVIEGNVPAKASTIKELKAALLNTDTTRIGLSNNVNLTEKIETNRDCTLDLNGNTITYTNTIGNVPISCNSGELRIENGSLDATEAKPSLVPICAWGGKVILDNINITINTSEESCVFCQAGEVIINSGVYINKSNKNYDYAGGAPLVLNTKNGGNGKITCYGGFFVGRDPALGDDSNGGTFVAEDYESVPTYMHGYNGYLVRKKKD